MSFYDSFLKVGVILLVFYSVIRRIKNDLDEKREKDKIKKQNEKA